MQFTGAANLNADDGTLNINGAILDVGTLGTADADGVLNVANPWNSNAADSVDLNGGELRGAAITNDGLNGISGFGAVTARVNNNSRVGAGHNGTLRLTNALSDWDGPANTGTLNAVSGDLEIVDTATFGFGGTVNIGNGREFFVNGFNLDFNPGSTLVMNGGRLRSGNLQTIGGAVTVNTNPARLQTTATIQSTATVALNSDLELDDATTVESGATFSGGGSLVNLAGSALTLADGADVDVLVENSGTLILGASPGQTTGLDFQQFASGNWDLELGGLGLNDFDRMNLTGAAAIDGALDLSLIMGYVPTLGDTLNILSAAGGIAGNFSSIVQPATMPSGLAFEANNLGTILQLQVVNASVLAGDFDNDGDIDGRDFLIWQRGGSPTPLSAGDLTDWQSNYGTGPLVAAVSAVPEPHTLWLLAASVLFVPCRRRR